MPPPLDVVVDFARSTICYLNTGRRRGTGAGQRRGRREILPLHIGAALHLERICEGARDVVLVHA